MVFRMFEPTSFVFVTIVSMPLADGARGARTRPEEAFLAPFGTPFAMPDVEFNAPRRAVPLPDGTRGVRTRPDFAFLALFGPPFVMCPKVKFGSSAWEGMRSR
tara:strand:+ start:142 stop:450 length:309 start_codon:yes stop_codon:yes gene_type:complete